ncbi:MAG: peptidoglycan DD-metalloendopeptidase family protein [Kofleriaceae bacterium]
MLAGMKLSTRRTTLSLCSLLSVVACGKESAPADDEPTPPPASFVEVGPALAAQRTPTVAAAQAAITELRSGDFDAVRSRFSAALAAQISATDLEAAWLAVEAEAPVGDLLADRFIAAARFNGNAYVAEHAWAAARLQFRIELDGVGDFSFFEFSAAEVLPVDTSPTTRHQLRPPFEGVWLVGEGPATEVLNHHSVEPTQRHASDIVVWRNGRTFVGAGTANTDYHAWRQRVLSPAAGTVAFVLDGEPDILPDPEAELGPGAHPAGNHVVIALGDGEFALLAHMQEGSIQVQPGDAVATGDVLGRVGNSGSTTEPHIHFHIQDTADFYQSTLGYRAPFSNFLLDGRLEQRREPGSPQFVQQPVR